MKLTIFRAALLLAVSLGVAVVSTRAQTEPTAGSYRQMAVSSKEARAAAAVAVKNHSSTHPKDTVRLVKILNAEEQVVAGMNYRICMVVKNRKGVRRTVTAVVYQPPNHKMRSTDWSAGSCKDI